MAKPSTKQITEFAEKGLQALQTLSVQFVSHLIEEGSKGVALDIIVTSFARNQAKIVSGILGGAGLATGAWAAISLWTSSLGLWGGGRLCGGLGLDAGLGTLRRRRGRTDRSWWRDIRRTQRVEKP